MVAEAEAEEEGAGAGAVVAEGEAVDAEGADDDADLEGATGVPPGGDEEGGEVEVEDMGAGWDGGRGGEIHVARRRPRCATDCNPEIEAQNQAWENMIRPDYTAPGRLPRQHMGRAGRHVAQWYSTHGIVFYKRNLRDEPFLPCFAHTNLRPLGKFDPRGLCPKLSPLPKALS